MDRLVGRIVLLYGWKRALVAFLAGAFAVLTQPPFDFFAAGFISFPVLVLLLDGASGDSRSGWLRSAWPFFRTGWWFGFGYFVAGLWWIGRALLVEADAHAWALPFAVVGLPAVLALFYGLGCALARPFWHGDLARILALGAGFGAAEYARSVLFTGFPWNAIGQALMPVPLLMQSAALIGVIGMNAIAVYIFAVPALLTGKRYRKTGLGLALILIAIHAGFGAWRLYQPVDDDVPTLHARIVQPSVDQAEKWNPETRNRIFETYLALTARKPEDGMPVPQLVVWPETALPWLVTERPEVLSAIDANLADDQILLTGAVRSEGDVSSTSARFYNSMTAINSAGEIIAAADKTHLVPFGEYLPFSNILEGMGFELIANAPGQFTPGARRNTIELPGSLSILPLICYEVIFPLEAGLASGKPANLIVNVTNDAWYGRTPGPWQHFRQAQIRAVELGLPMLRAANNGISALVDERGRIVDALALDSVGNLDVAVPLRRESVPFGHMTLNGVFVILLLAGLALCASLVDRSRRI